MANAAPKLGNGMVETVVDALRDNSASSDLTLVNKGIFPSDAFLLASGLAVNSSVLRLNISDNKLEDEGATALASALAINTTLTSLSMRDNKVTDLGLEALSNGLALNTSLLRLDVSRNTITSASLASMQACLARNRTMCRLHLGALETPKERRTDLLQQAEEEGEAAKGPLTDAFVDVAHGIDAATDGNGLLELKVFIARLLSDAEAVGRLGVKENVPLLQACATDTPTEQQAVLIPDGYLHVLGDKVMACACIHKEHPCRFSHEWAPPRRLFQIGKDFSVEEFLTAIGVRDAPAAGGIQPSKDARAELQVQEGEAEGLEGAESANVMSYDKVAEIQRVLKGQLVESAVRHLKENKVGPLLDLSSLGMTEGLLVGDMRAIGDAVARNTSVQCLDLSGNRIGQQAMGFFLESLKANSTLYKINLSSNLPTAGAPISKDQHEAVRILMFENVLNTVHLNQGPTHLDLSSCHLTDTHVQRLSYKLRNNSTIERLDLDGNEQLTGESCDRLSMVLGPKGGNTTLCFVLLPLKSVKRERLDKLLFANLEAKTAKHDTVCPSDYEPSPLFGYHQGPYQITVDGAKRLHKRDPARLIDPEFNTPSALALFSVASVSILPGWDAAWTHRFLRLSGEATVKVPPVDPRRGHETCLPAVGQGCSSVERQRMGGGFSMAKLKMSCGSYRQTFKLRGLCRIGVLAAMAEKSMAEKDEAYEVRLGEFLGTAWQDANTSPEFAHGVVGKARNPGNLSARGVSDAPELPEDAFGVWYYDSGEGFLKFGDAEVKKCKDDAMGKQEEYQMTLQVDLDTAFSVTFSKGEEVLGTLYGIPAGRQVHFAAQPMSMGASVSFA